MKSLLMVLSLMVLSLILLTSCGDYLESELTILDSDYRCPGSFYYNPNSLLCEDGNDAIGPWPSQMIELCKKAGGGRACDNYVWDKRFAKRLRGNSQCPRGAWLEGRICTDGIHAYGPFTWSQYRKCLSLTNQSQACKSNRWNVNIAWKATPPRRYAHNFPFTGPAWQDYTRGGVTFGACRGQGCWRKHAGVDLIQREGHPIFAVGDGTVVDYQYFYQGTYALVVNHGDFVVRYGEIQKDLPRGIRVGYRVKGGQMIARVGDLIDIRHSMLHFEMYSGKGTGPLTQRRPPYQRRWDLLNPTNKLLAWPYPMR